MALLTKINLFLKKFLLYIECKTHYNEWFEDGILAEK